MSLNPWEDRHRRLAARLEQEQLDGLLVTHLPHLRYLYDFEGTAGLALWWQGESILLVDGRYFRAAQRQTHLCQVALAPLSLEEALEGVLRERLPGSLARLGFESHHLTVEAYQRIESWKLPLEWQPCYDLIEKLRAVKDETEIEAVRKAVELAQTALDSTLGHYSEKMTESDWAARLEFEMRQGGSEAAAFETIVAWGTNSANPHARTGLLPLKPSSPFLVDFGARARGYHSDLTRLICPTGCDVPEITEVVLKAQQAAIESIRPGVEGSQVDARARGVIEQAGYGDYFNHGTGHGLGLELHEHPRLSSRFSDTLEKGMIVTVEPGIYLPERGGVRIEDVVLVTESGCQVLSDRSRQILRV